jgi:pSer/pThr/pTyr-binding forkhead associated (FHA) protein
MGFAPHSLTASELAALMAVEGHGEPFLAFREGTGDLRFSPLKGAQRLSVGRTEGNDVVLSWDPQVSRVHAQLENAGGMWLLVDDGLSRNGCFVNGERVRGRTLLTDGAMLRFGGTSVLFRAPGHGVDSTVAASAAALVRVTEAERRVLVALCEPLLRPGTAATPASNREIGERVNLSLGGVKTHIRTLFAKLDVEELPQNRKRAELARRAIEAGLVSARDLRD